LRQDGPAPSDVRHQVATMRDAIAELVHDGDTVAIEGFTHLICFAAGHEIDLSIDSRSATAAKDVVCAHGTRA